MDEEIENKDEIFLAVYGTLKENFPNYFYYLNPKKPIFRGAVKLPFRMYSNGGFPLLFPSKEYNKIYIEIYHVDEKIISRIDNLEGVPYLYSREMIYIEEVDLEVFIYVITNREPSGELVDDGIFRLK